MLVVYSVRVSLCFPKSVPVSVRSVLSPCVCIFVVLVFVVMVVSVAVMMAIEAKVSMACLSSSHGGWTPSLFPDDESWDHLVL